MSSPFEVWEERAKIAKISRFIGQKLEVLEEGVCKIELPFREEFEQIFGVVHGGFITMIADTAGYFAAATKVGEMPLATAEIKMNFLSPVYKKDLYAIGKVIKSGRQLIVCDLKVYTQQPDKMIAVGLASYSRVKISNKKGAILSPRM
jgi:uncharacterized protein (TIGR00369 family)